MIIPTRDAKSYGAVHIDHYLTFTGFCKKVYSDEIQSIDVLIDGQKIDTITCDKTIDKVSKIYDIDGYGFEYDLPEIYFDRRHILSFRCSDSGEELVNSPISTISRDDEKFNEYKFLHSLSKPIDEDKIKDMYCPNSIGFLATEENISNDEFIEYIKDLMMKLPNVNFIGFCFSHNIKILLNNRVNNIRINVISEIYDLKSNIEFFIWNRIDKFLSDQISLKIFSTTTYHIRFSPELRNISIKEFEKNDLTMNLIRNNLEDFGFNSLDLKNSNNNCIVMLNNHAKKYISDEVWTNITIENDVFDFYCLILPNYWISSIEYKKYFYEFILKIKNKVV